MRTPDPASPTKRKILDAAERLMLEKGFHAASVDEICREAGAATGSFFHFFHGKEALGAEALERYIDRELETLAVAPFRKDPDPVARVLGWIDVAAEAFADPSFPRSCLLGNLTQELASVHPGFQTRCARLFTRWAAGFVVDARAAARPRGASTKLDARGLGELYMSLIQGSLILIKAKKDPAIGVRNMRHFRRYVAGLLSAGGRP